ncbi:hypothetical protein ElyMa_006928600 [Elysia marginata]|uniref:Uncharacterized protein n=1 Tax=Elysia marginata TaxID=1093978 RepID=A0AAV4JHP2_9GAST|nr:hypothetical protein ElyMa_006928600 [Elysia marginata]
MVDTAHTQTGFCHADTRAELFVAFSSSWSTTPVAVYKSGVGIRGSARCSRCCCRSYHCSASRRMVVVGMMCGMRYCVCVWGVPSSHPVKYSCTGSFDIGFGFAGTGTDNNKEDENVKLKT